MRLTMMIVLLLSGSSLFAEPAQERQQIQTMIQELKTAPEGERHQVVNRFKEMVRSMERAQQNEAVEALNRAMEKNPDAPGLKQALQQVQERHRMQQEQQIEHKQMQQQMHQQQYRQKHQAPRQTPEPSGARP